ncbi:carbohydrate binding-domain-containing protein [Mycena leptocephala]|nr:carbohydrate binding-domain-containing protein [Mycena leptocephala]
MAPLVSVVLTALVASLVTAQEFASCGGSTYDPSQYTCFDGKLICPIVDGDKYLKCGDACYPTTQYTCINGELTPAGLARRDDCVPEFGDSQVCNDQGCFQLICCPGLISVADKCRDPCDVAPSNCPSSRRDDCVPEFGDSQSEVESQHYYVKKPCHLEWSIKLLFPIKAALQRVYYPPQNVRTIPAPGEDLYSRKADRPRIQNHPKSVTGAPGSK